ncbi:monocarboxylate transporter 9-like [Ixodes scapularis]
MTLAGLIFPRLLKFLKETYGFSSSFYIWGALNLNLIPLILLFKVPPWYTPGNMKQTSAGIAHNSGKERGMVNNEENNQASSTFPETVLSIARRPVFYLVEISSGINASVQFVVFTTMVDFAMDNGTADTIALWLTPCYLAVCSLGRIFLPLVADKKLVPRSDLLTACYVVMGVTLLVLPLATNFWVIAALCSLTAAGYGCNYTLHDVLAIDYFGLERLLFMHGVMGLAKAPFQLCMPKLIGFFRDDGGSYDNVYRLQGGLLLFAALLWLPVACRERRNRIGKFTSNNHR